MKQGIKLCIRSVCDSWTDTYDVLKLSNCVTLAPTTFLEPTHMMYWNQKEHFDMISLLSLEPTHMMYWNRRYGDYVVSDALLEPTHMMYWNKPVEYKAVREADLNRHIWCIETGYLPLLTLSGKTWTDTYDVLKPCKIFILRKVCESWTDTYDVLKLLSPKIFKLFDGSWTDTYDVLKQLRPFFLRGTKLLEPTHMMYWNAVVIESIRGCNRLEPTHMMYWN